MEKGKQWGEGGGKVKKGGTRVSPSDKRRIIRDKLGILCVRVQKRKRHARAQNDDVENNRQEAKREKVKLCNKKKKKIGRKETVFRILQVFPGQLHLHFIAYSFKTNDLKANKLESSNSYGKS